MFFSDDDRRTYLTWLHEYCIAFKVELLAYCLMTNHVHLVAVPDRDDGLQRVLEPLHMRYAQRVNRAQGWKGPLWQGRFFSSPLDDAYLWAAVRYVERNPVRAALERRAEDYRWSSAAAHCGQRVDGLLSQASDWGRMFSGLENWSAWLAEGDEEEEIRTAMQNIERGLPCGSADFINEMSRQVGRALDYRAQGRPRKSGDTKQG